MKPAGHDHPGRHAGILRLRARTCHAPWSAAVLCSEKSSCRARRLTGTSCGEAIHPHKTRRLAVCGIAVNVPSPIGAVAKEIAHSNRASHRPTYHGSDAPPPPPPPPPPPLPPPPPPPPDGRGTGRVSNQTIKTI